MTYVLHYHRKTRFLEFTFFTDLSKFQKFWSLETDLFFKENCMRGTCGCIYTADATSIVTQRPREIESIVTSLLNFFPVAGESPPHRLVFLEIEVNVGR